MANMKRSRLMTKAAPLVAEISDAKREYVIPTPE
jgi:hypothetical protein